MGKQGKSGTVVVVNGCGCEDEHEEKHEHKRTNCCDPCGATKDGAAFVASGDIGSFVTPVAVEVPTALLVNPVGSGKNLYVNTRSMSVLGSDDAAVSFKWYLDPQVIALGNPASIVNQTTTDKAKTTVAQHFTSPNVASNGTQIDAFASQTGTVESTATLIIAEGHSLLVTERATAENIRASTSIYWTECKVPKMHHEEPDGDEGEEG